MASVNMDGIATVMEICGCSSSRAFELLESSTGDVSAATNLFFSLPKNDDDEVEIVDSEGRSLPSILPTTTESEESGTMVACAESTALQQGPSSGASQARQAGKACQVATKAGGVTEGAGSQQHKSNDGDNKGRISAAMADDDVDDGFSPTAQSLSPTASSSSSASPPPSSSTPSSAQAAAPSSSASSSSASSSSSSLSLMDVVLAVAQPAAPPFPPPPPHCAVLERALSLESQASSLDSVYEYDDDDGSCDEDNTGDGDVETSMADDDGAAAAASTQRRKARLAGSMKKEERAREKENAEKDHGIGLATFDVSELNAFMSTPEAVADFCIASSATSSSATSTSTNTSTTKTTSTVASTTTASTAAVAAVPSPSSADNGNDNGSAGGGVRANGGVRAGVWSGSKGKGSVVVWVALNPARFLLDFERAVAWGLDPALDLAVRLEFDPLYLDSLHAPKVTCVTQCPPGCDLNVKDLKEVHTFTCGLEWVLKDRLNSFFKEDSHWPPRGLVVRRPVVAEVVECTGVDPCLAKEALARKLGDKSEAINLLMGDGDEDDDDDVCGGGSQHYILYSLYHGGVGGGGAKQAGGKKKKMSALKRLKRDVLLEQSWAATLPPSFWSLPLHRRRAVCELREVLQDSQAASGTSLVAAVLKQPDRLCLGDDGDLLCVARAVEELFGNEEVVSANLLGASASSSLSSSTSSSSYFNPSVLNAPQSRKVKPVIKSKKVKGRLPNKALEAQLQDAAAWAEATATDEHTAAHHFFLNESSISEAVRWVPQTRQHLKDIRAGWGLTKINKYSTPFLAVVNGFLNENGLELDAEFDLAEAREEAEELSERSPLEITPGEPTGSDGRNLRRNDQPEDERPTGCGSDSGGGVTASMATFSGHSEEQEEMAVVLEEEAANAAAAFTQGSTGGFDLELLAVGGGLAMGGREDGDRFDVGDFHGREWKAAAAVSGLAAVS
eukprot:CAMPEP_0171777626 /NCGR_PEP_ID=MMETSP0991-20121206/57900_1 /TAXON_ID=483369 /ORGANISM="non described non described, Strain CCMP2098" /LENGTH=957 /DNA_ID=CAMNT_0012384389 /DNA_START=1 /DNA_END=2871 /DNA_ORIENTATION=+